MRVSHAVEEWSFCLSVFIIGALVSPVSWVQCCSKCGAGNMDTTGGTRQMDMFMVQVVMACRHCDFLFVNFALINVIWFWFITKCDVSSINLQCHLSRFLLWNLLGLKNPHLFKVWSDWKSLRTTGCIYCIRLLLTKWVKGSKQISHPKKNVFNCFFTSWNHTVQQRCVCVPSQLQQALNRHTHGSMVRR